MTNPKRCKAKLFIADDYGDNETTIKCQLIEGHAGVHKERYKSKRAGRVLIAWENDESETEEEKESRKTFYELYDAPLGYTCKDCPNLELFTVERIQKIVDEYNEPFKDSDRICYDRHDVRCELSNEHCTKCEKYLDSVDY